MTGSMFAFDAYGTLFDVGSAINAHRAAVGPNADELIALWRSKQLGVVSNTWGLWRCCPCTPEPSGAG
jgi:FMN phosphatase YigB (HAD superfamily)